MTADQELQQLRKDAERYRWLRDEATGDIVIAELLQSFQLYVRAQASGHQIDAAIDAAMAKDGK